MKKDNLQDREQYILSLYERLDEAALTPKKEESLNLLKCIQTYRVCPSVSMLLKNKPQLVRQLDEIYKLWKKFDKMNEEELAELTMQVINELL